MPGPDAVSAARQRMEEAVAAVAERAGLLEEQLRPVRLLRPAEEAALRRFVNADHLAAARRYGVTPDVDAAAVAELLEAGRLVRLEESRYWIVRELGYSQPVVVPAVVELLTAIGERFHEQLEEHAVPPLRFEVSSALRTAEDQAALRRANPNAASGTSTHQFGTTVDLAYSGYHAPEDPLTALGVTAEPELASALGRVAALAIERAAARKSRELEAILGRVLAELQEEGRVLVTLERLQPVYHVTVTGLR